MRTLAWWLRWFRSLPIFDPPTTRIAKSVDEIARDIDAILYSDLSCDEMLKRLAPYAAVGEHARLFVKRTGIHPAMAFCIGPYPTDYFVPGCGLEFVMDDLFQIHIIRRSQKTIEGVEYSHKSISAPTMICDGYARHYEN